MERKATQRVIGVLVVIALAIIVLPVFLSGNDIATIQSAHKKSLSQPIHLASASEFSSVVILPQVIVVTPSKTEKMLKDLLLQAQAQENSGPSVLQIITQKMLAQAQLEQETAKPQLVLRPYSKIEQSLRMLLAAQTESSKQPMRAVSRPVRPASYVAQLAKLKKEVAEADARRAEAGEENVIIIGENEEAMQVPEGEITDTAVSSDTQHLSVKTIENPPLSVRKERMTVPDTTAKSVKKPHSHAPVMMRETKRHTSSRVWAIQVGTFKKHDNAIRLVNQLRAKGFKVFTREAKNRMTSVYVGPEGRQLIALNLVQRIEHEINMHGLLIHYEPTAV